MGHRVDDELSREARRPWYHYCYAISVGFGASHENPQVRLAKNRECPLCGKRYGRP